MKSEPNPVILSYPPGVDGRELSSAQRRKLRGLLRQHAQKGTRMNELMRQRETLEQQIFELVGSDIANIRLPDLNGFVVFPDHEVTWDEKAIGEELDIDLSEYAGVLCWSEVDFSVTARYPSTQGPSKVLASYRKFTMANNGMVNDDSIKMHRVVNETVLQRLCKERGRPVPYHARKVLRKGTSWKSRPQRTQ